MIVGPAMPMPRMLSTGGAFASAISSARIISSMKVSPRPPYSLGQVSPMNPAAWSLRCQSRSRSYASARGTSDDAARRAVHSRGMFPRSQARTSSRNDRCSGVGVSSMTPPGRRPGARLNDDSASFYGAPSAEVKAAAAAAAVSELRPKRLEERCAGEILPGGQGFGYLPTVCSSRREGREREWGDTATDRAGAQHGGSSAARGRRARASARVDRPRRTETESERADERNRRDGPVAAAMQIPQPIQPLDGQGENRQ